MPQDEQQLVTTARKRLEGAIASEQEIRREAELDLKFLIGDQWCETPYNRPGKPIVINRLRAFRNQVVNDIRQNNPQVHVSPRSGGDSDTADVLEGLVRYIQNEPDAQVAFAEAAKYAVGSSFGVFELVAEQVDEETGEHELHIEPIYDPATVYFDPAALKPDRSDSRWAIKIVILSRLEFKERWPKAELTAAGFTAQSDYWMNPHGDGDHIRIAEYWCVEQAGTSNVAYGNDMTDEMKVARRKKTRGYELVKHILSGKEELEPPTLHPGKCVPLFPVYGDELWVNGKRFIGSLIRDARGIQVLYNWQANKEAETLAMAPKNPYLATPKMIENHESEWDQMNNSPKNYVLFNVDPEAPGGKPYRDWAEPPIQAISIAKQNTASEMRDVIGLQDPSLGKQQYAGQSGKAIAQLRAQGDLSTFQYTDNLTRTMRHLGRVLLDWISFYYDTQQELAILGPDMEEKIVMVNTEQPHTDPTTGQTYHYRLDHGKYQLSLVMGPSYATEREEFAENIQAIIQAWPEGMQIFGDLMLAHRDFAGAQAASERVKRWIAATMPGLIDDPKNPVPPQMQAQMAQMQAQIQQLSQALQQAGMVIKTKQIEQQGRLEVEKTKGQFAIAKASIEAGSEAAHAVQGHKLELFKATLQHFQQQAEQALNMLQESELAPGPDVGSQGLHPSAIPQPAQPGAPA